MLQTAQLQVQVLPRVQVVPAEFAPVALQQMQAASAMFPQLGAVMLPQLSALGLLPRASSGPAPHLTVPRAAAQCFPEQLPLVVTRPLPTPLANPITNLLARHPAMMPGKAGEHYILCASGMTETSCLLKGAQCICCIFSSHHDNETSSPTPPCAEVH